jgi:uncharacterized protein YwqG
MNFFKKLFNKPAKQEEPAREKIKLAPEEFFNLNEVKALIGKYKRPATLLHPRKSETPIGYKESKFGGLPNYAGFDAYPCCDSCKTPLNFVLQLYKKDFPGFYFPGGMELFQLFRCPNNECAEDFSEYADHKMFHYYFTATENNKSLVKPSHNLTDTEDEVPDCYLKPQVIDDYPHYEDYDENDLDIYETYDEELSELFNEKYTVAPRSKFGGYPSYTQSPAYPTCTCGKLKEFFFQLSSEDLEDGVEELPSPGEWSDHGIMIGDLGNIYYYVCKACGPATIESNWDCH